jgi:hypothetical protein
MSIRNGKRSVWGEQSGPARKTDFTAICEPTAYDNVGSLTSHNPIDLHGLFTGTALKNT